MYREPEAWHLLMSKLSTLVSDYLIAQIEVGAAAVQIFDSWAGALSPFDYAEYVLPYVHTAIARVHTWAAARGQSDLPVIYFGTDMAGMGNLLRQTGADVLGVDWRIPLDRAWENLGHDCAVQGNLDPAVLFAPWPEIERRAEDILMRADSRPGHIFNLGHGILTETPVDSVRRLAEFVHEFAPVRR
jgi:uroporphyrinogen decarboxylase